MSKKSDPDAAVIGKLYHKGFEDLREAGRKLKMKKASLGPREWAPWVANNHSVLGFKLATADRLIKSILIAGDQDIWGHSTPRGALGTGDDEWNTPIKYIEMARTVLGTIDLTPASNAFAQSRVKAKKFYTKKDSGLTKKWAGKVWLNPPYSQPLITKFTTKLVAEYQAGHVTEAILLTNNSTDTEWFQATAQAAAVICFTRGRIKFEKPNSVHESPICGQAFFYLGRSPAKFVKVFEKIGVCL